MDTASDAHDWAVVLAGGDGTRLRAEAEALYGYPRPKQFCAFGGGPTLVEETLYRALLVTGSPDRVLVSVSRAHAPEVAECLAGWPVARVEQPRNRDTGPGLILPVLHVLALDPGAMLYVLPSDHQISHDGRFVAAMRSAARRLLPEEVALVGIRMDRPEEGLGWIVPGPDDERSLPPVEAFVEKPDGAALVELWRGGALANTFAMVGRASAFAGLFRRHCREWWDAATAARGAPEALDRVYDALPACNLSSEVLQRAGASLRVARLVGVAWSDIGTPERLSARERSPGAA